MALFGLTRGQTAGLAVLVGVVAVASVVWSVVVPKGSLSITDDMAQQLVKAADDVNGHVPNKIDAVTTLNRAEYKNQVFSYYYAIDPSLFTSDNWSVDKMKANVIKRACDIFKNYFNTPALSRVHYVYQSLEHPDLEINVTGGDCAS